MAPLRFSWVSVTTTFIVLGRYVETFCFSRVIKNLVGAHDRLR
jgi:hypothetical protein